MRDHDDIDIDKLESFIASKIPLMMVQHRQEVALKQKLYDISESDIKFKYEFSDMRVVCPLKLATKYPEFHQMSRYDWFTISNYTDNIIIFKDSLFSEIRETL